MRRRTFVAASLLTTLAPGLAVAQPATPAPAQPQPHPTPAHPTPAAPAAAAAPQADAFITPQNALERTFVAAVDSDQMKAVFRRQFLDSQVALALSSQTPDAPPRQIEVRGVPACLIFTSSARATEVMGAQAPRVMLTGRQALERARGANVVININLRPFLTLDADGVEGFLALPADAPASPPAPPPPPASAGPSQ